jgi:4-carboxymuconolactone decarboxylase
MVDLPSKPLADVDPEFEAMALETGAFTYELHGTSTREKLLQNLANDICRLHLGLAFRLHVRAAAMYGIPFADLLALIRFTAPYAGYPAAADALGRLGELAGEFGIDTAPGDPGRAPPATGPSIASDDPWVARFLADRTARAWSEKRLTPRERAVVALTTDVGRQTLGESFRLHVRLAQDGGMTEEEIRDVVRFCGEMGLATAAAAIHALGEILPAQDGNEERHRVGG